MKEVLSRIFESGSKFFYFIIQWIMLKIYVYIFTLSWFMLDYWLNKSLLVDMYVAEIGFESIVTQLSLRWNI